MKTTTDERCDITELYVSQCACRKHRNLPDPVSPANYTGEGDLQLDEDRKGKWIIAQFSGICYTCDQAYDKGTPIRDDGHGKWEASCCE